MEEDAAISLSVICDNGVSTEVQAREGDRERERKGVRYLHENTQKKKHIRAYTICF